MSYDKSARTRDKLLQATATLLRSKGYAAMGLSDIIAASGVPKGSLYHHFPAGKEALSAAAIDYSGNAILEEVTRLIDKCGDPVIGLKAFCDFYIQQLEESGYQKGCPLATVALETAHGVPMVQEACSRAFTSYRNLLAHHLHLYGAAEDTSQNLASLILSSVEGALILAKAHNDTASLKLVRDQLADQLAPYSAAQSTNITG